MKLKDLTGSSDKYALLKEHLREVTFPRWGYGSATIQRPKVRWPEKGENITMTAVTFGKEYLSNAMNEFYDFLVNIKITSFES